MRSILKIGDKQIIVDHPEGSSLKIEGGKLSTEPVQRSVEHDLKEELGKQGVQWGDAIAWVTHKAGFEQCAGCVKRQHLLNQAKQLGVRETVRQVVETFRGKQ